MMVEVTEHKVKPPAELVKAGMRVFEGEAQELPGYFPACGFAFAGRLKTVFLPESLVGDRQKWNRLVQQAKAWVNKTAL